MKIIVLKRNRTDTIKSFEKWFGKLHHFPWVSRIEREKFKQVFIGRTPYKNVAAYDQCYPFFELEKFGLEPDQSFPTIKQGATVYYDYYYAEVDRLVRMYPAKFFMVDTYEILNDDDTKNDVLDWLGLPRPHILPIDSSTKGHQTNVKKMKEIAEKYG